MSTIILEFPILYNFTTRELGVLRVELLNNQNLHTLLGRRWLV